MRTRSCVTDPSFWRDVGRARGEFFRAAAPATTLIVVAGSIDPAILVEIEADAVV